MSCVCGSLECTCQERCLCTQEGCTCERCDDLRSGRTLRSFEYEDMHTQPSDGETLHSILQVSAEEKLETVEDPGAQSLPFSASWQASSAAYSGRIQEAKPSISEKPHESYKNSSSRSSPLSSSTHSPKGYTPVKRSFSSPEDIVMKYFGSTKCMDQSTIQSGSGMVVSSDTEATTPVKKIRCIDSSDKEGIPMDVDSSENVLSPGKKGKCVDSTAFNQCQAISKPPEATPEPSFSRNLPSNPSYNRFRFPDEVQLSPGRKYTVMISQNILSSSTEPTRSRASSASAIPSIDDVRQTIPQPYLASTKYVSKFDSSQKSSGLASASCERKSSDASESTEKSIQSPNVYHHSTRCRSDSTGGASSRRCMPIISPPLADMGSGRFDFAWQGSPQRPSSVDSYFDQIRPSSALRASGNLDDVHRMNRVVRQFVVPLEEFKKKAYQHVSSADEVENLRPCRQSEAPDSAKPVESSASNVGSQNTEPNRETGAEVPTFISGVIQGDPDIDDPFILKGFPHDTASDESNTGSGSPSEG